MKNPKTKGIQTGQNYAHISFFKKIYGNVMFYANPEL